MHQLRLRYIWITWGTGLTVWFQVAGRKPLAHLPRWRRRLLHLPGIRWRLWPRPWNFNGPVAGYRRAYEDMRQSRERLWMTGQDLLPYLVVADRTAAYDKLVAALTGTEVSRAKSAAEHIGELANEGRPAGVPS